MDIDDQLSAAALAAKAAERLSEDPKTIEIARATGKRLATAKSVSKVVGAGVVGSTVVGASGASIMSILATAGAVVGGGVVAGVGLVAGGAGAGAAKLLNDTTFKNDKGAKVGTYAGAAAGTATSLGTLAVAGAGPSGLAAIGSIVGGGMAAGAVAVLAAPVVGAAAVGAAVYFWRKKKRAPR